MPYALYLQGTLTSFSLTQVLQPYLSCNPATIHVRCFICTGSSPTMSTGPPYFSVVHYSNFSTTCNVLILDQRRRTGLVRARRCKSYCSNHLIESGSRRLSAGRNRRSQSSRIRSVSSDCKIIVRHGTTHDIGDTISSCYDC